jgi:hypothetical protein
MSHKDQQEVKLSFGDHVESIAASNDNPHKRGIFVELVYREGKLNHGEWCRITDGNGRFWETTPDNLKKIEVPSREKELLEIVEGLEGTIKYLTTPITLDMAYSARGDALSKECKLKVDQTIAALTDWKKKNL